MNLLNKLQTELKAPKNQFNKFGKYNYRSCEDIFEGLKPLLEKHDCSIVVSDIVMQLGNRFYVCSTAQLLDNENKVVAEASAYAREAESKKGMDEAQVSGSTSSYARKYALSGLLAIDDSKDGDYLGNGKDLDSKYQKPVEGENPYEIKNPPAEQGEQMVLSEFQGSGAPEDRCYSIRRDPGQVMDFEVEANLRIMAEPKASSKGLDDFMLQVQKTGSKGKGKTLDELKASVIEKKGFEKLWGLYAGTLR